MNFINTIDDLFNMLDRYTEGVDWNTFYIKRDKPAPFLKYNKLPDKCVVDFIKAHSIKNACEFGCGEGRNAIYLAKNGVDTEAYDLSEIAIENAKRNARESKAEKVVFNAENIFELDLTDKRFDLVIDSGVFHHLPPHRRLQYRDIVSNILTENGCFILLCFAAGEDGADEVDDYEFYKGKQTGVAFTKERLKGFWGEKFDIIELRKGENIIDAQMWESEYLYVCMFKKQDMIKEINEKDIAECVNVIKESFLTVADELGFTVDNAPRFTAFATTEARLVYQLENEHRPMFAYYDDNKIIGYYSLALQDNDECELNNLCVLPQYRHRHIGARLLDDACIKAKEFGCKKMSIGIVEENTILRKWYEDKGFIHIGTKKFDFFPFTCGYMERDL